MGARSLSGPVIGCIEEGAEGLATAGIADSLARRLGADLLLATVRQAGAPKGEDLTPVAARNARLLLDRAARELDEGAAIRVAVGEPAEKLLALADGEGAELLVVSAGARSRRLLGSVYLALAGAASCPVVVIPPGVEAIASTGPIVCGDDGSPAALAAAELAARLGTPLVLVHAEHGPAAERLAHIARAKSAQMVVTGSRGRGEGASALLGSVASELATTADRPLMIVPPGHGRALTTSWLRSGGAVLSIRSGVASLSDPRLERAAAQVLATTGGRLVIDLSARSAIDDESVAVLARLAGRAGELGGSLTLVASAPGVRRRLEGIAPWVVVTEALDDALETIAERSYTAAAG